MTEAQLRQRIVNFCEWGIRNAPKIHYAQVRPIPQQVHKLPLVTDCSGFATLAYKSAGAPDPNGNDYDGSGYTGTLMRHGRKLRANEQPLPGDLFFFGAFPGHHVTIFMEEWHGAWVTCSHGQEIGPLRILNHQEQLAQGLGEPFQIRRYL